MNVNELCCLFEGCLSADEKTRTAATNALITSSKEAPFLLIDLSIQVLQIPNLKLSIYQYALITIKNSINYDNSFIEVWFSENSVQLRQRVQEAIIQSLVKDESIALLSGSVFANLFKLEQDKLFELFNSLSELCKTQSSISTKRLIINSFCEICNRDCFSNLKSFTQITGWLFNFFTSYFISTSPPIIFQSAIGLSRLIKIDPSAFRNVDSLKQITQQSAAVIELKNVKLMGAIINLLKEMMIHLYNESFYMEMAQSISGIMITITQIPNPDVANYALEFWHCFAQFELDIKQQKDYYVKFSYEFSQVTRIAGQLEHFPEDPDYKLICARSLDSLLPICIHIMTMIDINRTECDDLTNYMPHVYANIALRTISKLHPEKVFQAILSFWQNSKETEDWRVQNALLLSLNSLSKTQHYYEFFESVIVTVFSALNSKIPRVLETAIYAIESLFENYGNILNQERLNILWPLLKNIASQPTPFPISLRILSFIVKFTGFLSKMTISKRSEIYERNIVQILEIITIIKARPDACENDFVIYGALSLVVEYSTDKCYQMLFPFFQESVEIIMHSNPSDDRFQSRVYCTNLINAFFNKFPRQLADFSSVLIGRYLEILEVKRANVHEEILVSACHIFKSMENPTDDQHVQSFHRYLIESALTSGSPSLINKAIMVIGSMSMKTEFPIDALQEIFNIVRQCMEMPFFTQEARPEILHSFSTLLGSFSSRLADPLQYPSRKECITSLINFFLNALYYPADYTNQDEVEYACKMCCSVYEGLTNCAKALNPPDSSNGGIIERRLIRRMFNYLRKELCQFPKITAELADVIYAFLVEVDSHFNSNVNVLLNNKGIKYLLIASAAIHHKDNTKFLNLMNHFHVKTSTGGAVYH